MKSSFCVFLGFATTLLFSGSGFAQSSFEQRLDQQLGDQQQMIKAYAPVSGHYVSEQIEISGSKYNVVAEMQSVLVKADGYLAPMPVIAGQFKFLETQNADQENPVSLNVAFNLGIYDAASKTLSIKIDVANGPSPVTVACARHNDQSFDCTWLSSSGSTGPFKFKLLKVK